MLLSLNLASSKQHEPPKITPPRSNNLYMYIIS